MDRTSQVFTEQARMVFCRTAVSGDAQLGDGKFVAPGVQAGVAGRAGGGNVIRLHSEAVGRGLTVDIAGLSPRNALSSSADTQTGRNELAAAVMLRVTASGKARRRLVPRYASRKAGTR